MPWQRRRLQQTRHNPRQSSCETYPPRPACNVDLWNPRGGVSSSSLLIRQGKSCSPVTPPCLSYNLHDTSLETLKMYLSSGGLRATLVTVNECPSGGVSRKGLFHMACSCTGWLRLVYPRTVIWVDCEQALGIGWNAGQQPSGDAMFSIGPC